MISIPPFIPEHPLIEQSAPLEGLTVIGVNARTAGRRLRDRLFVEEPDYESVLKELKADGRNGVVLIATCERFDFLLSKGADADQDYYTALIAGEAGLEQEFLRKQCYCHRGLDALRHIFAVAASLDSLVVGEPQILGQVKDCVRRAQTLELLDPLLDGIIQASLAAAKRVRSETTIAQQPISLASSALQVARGVHGDLGRCSLLLTGSGEVGELLCSEFLSAGIKKLLIAHPRAGRSETAVFRLGGEARAWGELEEALEQSDIIISAVGGGDSLFTRDLVERALKKRKRKPLFLIDTTPSSEVEKEVNNLDGAFSYDLLDLENVARQGKAHREAAMMAAWKVLGQEMQFFLRKKAERQAVPGISLVRQHFESLRTQVLAECGDDAEIATRLLINRLLHNPLAVLKETASENPDAQKILDQALCRLFRLESPGGESAGHDDAKED
ncbi:glutamyl-tRNA reductase [Kiloniella laminariae]|uniref:Glutamyl-tRNA reductase n=1 Tax=Kiloniella laminariae TaxID=454162 RepID=A0ABT4LM32_9PROT|nr:glutamyl-tRNA reductase [Kiloniella laminariae]MCZ4282152.1 glutamyl-tRNA reductase [Kiloniella laminariae]